MSACAATGPFGDGALTCVRPTHYDHGHVYESTSAGDAEDGGHDD